jgi:hypothetical protein
MLKNICNKFFYLKILIIFINYNLFLFRCLLKTKYKKSLVIKLFKWRLPDSLNLWKNDKLINFFIIELFKLYDNRLNLYKYNSISVKIGIDNYLIKNLIGRVQIDNNIFILKEKDKIAVFSDDFFSSLGHFYYAFGYINLIINSKVNIKKIYFKKNINVINRYLYRFLINYAHDNNILTDIKTRNIIDLNIWFSENGYPFEPNELLINNEFYIEPKIISAELKKVLNFLELDFNKKIILLDLRSAGFNDRKMFNFSIRNHSLNERKQIIRILEKYTDEYNIIDISNHNISSNLFRIDRVKINKKLFELYSFLLFNISNGIIGSISGPLITSKLFGKKILLTCDLCRYDLPFKINNNEYIKTNLLNINNSKSECDQNIFYEFGMINKFALFNLGYEIKEKNKDDFNNNISKFFQNLR